jgi:hypothetical protein
LVYSTVWSSKLKQLTVLNLFRGTQSTDISPRSALPYSLEALPTPFLAILKPQRPGSSETTLAPHTASKVTKNKLTQSACTTATVSGPLTRLGKTFNSATVIFYELLKLELTVFQYWENWCVVVFRFSICLSPSLINIISNSGT